jgi:DNA-binding transcriptional MerR regulator
VSISISAVNDEPASTDEGVSARPADFKEGDRGHMTVEEFGGRIGMSARNIRALQGRGLLPPPVRQGRRAFYFEEHVDRAEAIKDLQRQGFNLFAIATMLGTGANDPEAAGMAAMLDRVTSRYPALMTGLGRHRIIARTVGGELRVTRPKPIQTALALCELGVPVSAALGILVAVLDSVEPASGELVRQVHSGIVDNWDPRQGPGLGSHPMTRTQAVITLLSEAQRVVLENAGSALLRGVLNGAR